MMLIDPPSPFSPREEWQQFLEDMEAHASDLARDAALVRSYIGMAKRELGIADEPRFRCPSCKQKRGVNISYGYPSEELFRQAERNEAVLGGCMQALDDPDRQCLACGHQWAIVRRKHLASDEGQA